MNIKRNIFAMLAAAVLLASCSQDEVMTDTGPDGLVPVTLSAAVGDGVQTRATTTDEGEARRCMIQILEKNEEEWQNAITNLKSNPASMNKSVSDPSQFVIDVMLNPNKEYTFLFWADEDKGFYDASDLKNVKIVNGSRRQVHEHRMAGKNDVG